MSVAQPFCGRTQVRNLSQAGHNCRHARIRLFVFGGGRLTGVPAVRTLHGIVNLRRLRRYHDGSGREVRTVEFQQDAPVRENQDGPAQGRRDGRRGLLRQDKGKGRALTGHNCAALAGGSQPGLQALASLNQRQQYGWYIHMYSPPFTLAWAFSPSHILETGEERRQQTPPGPTLAPGGIPASG